MVYNFGDMGLCMGGCETVRVSGCLGVVWVGARVLVRELVQDGYVCM